MSKIKEFIFSKNFLIKATSKFQWIRKFSKNLVKPKYLKSKNQEFYFCSVKELDFYLPSFDAFFCKQSFHTIHYLWFKFSKLNISVKKSQYNSTLMSLSDPGAYNQLRISMTNNYFWLIMHLRTTKLNILTKLN